MVTFRNNNGRRSNFRRNERNFKSNGDRNKFNNNFSDAGYSFTSTVFDGSGRNDLRNIGHDRNNDTYTSSALEYYCWNYAATTLDDAFRYFGQFMGDLA